MKVLIDLDARQVEALDALARQAKRSRAALIRAAIADYLDRHRQLEAREAFGLWGKSQVDGLAYQKKLRDEW
jgi:predicted transcriptional regulator